MAIYDTSAVLRCSSDRDLNTCKLITSDPECTIPPTVANEIRSKRLSIPSNCKIYTYDTEPFILNTEPIAFATAVKDLYLRDKFRKTKGKPWIPSKAEKAAFARACTTVKQGAIDLNDWQILKEANILAEEGYVTDARLITDDRHIYLPFCLEQYENVMEHMPEIAGYGYEREELEVSVEPLREVLKEFAPAVARV